MKRRAFTAAAALAAGGLGLAPRAHAQDKPWPYPTFEAQVPIVIAHRGASGERPEHTLAAYALAIDQGADYIEPDLVITRDGVLVARHDNELSLTTDVASRPEFAAHRRTQQVDGRELSGWFVEDFTLAEVKRLRANERFVFRSARYNGAFEIPTLQEVIDLAQARGRALGRRVGLYPETKFAAHFAAAGLPLEAPLVKLLTANGFTSEDDPVFVQSFEPRSLQRLAALTALRTVQLVAERGAPADLAGRGDKRSFADLISPSGLLEVSTYADGIGLAKNLAIPRAGDGRLGSPSDLIERAHAAGLRVHAWTFRSENNFLPTDMQGAPELELERFLAAGIDGVFSDQPGAAVKLVRRLRERA